MHRQLEDGIFVSAPSASLSPPSRACLRYTPHPSTPSTPPTLTLRLWHRCLDKLWIEERADKSLHGDSAICKSCCGSRVFFFPLSPFSLLLSQPPACTQPLPFSHTHAYLFCISSSLHSCKSEQRYLLRFTYFSTLHFITFFTPLILSLLKCFN